MTENELTSMTVMQLRKLAKENNITLGAGIDKAGIIQKILENLSSEPQPDDIFSQWFIDNNDELKQESFAYERNNELIIEEL